MKRKTLLAMTVAAALLGPALAGADDHVRVEIIVESHDEKLHDGDTHPAYRPDHHRPRVVIHRHTHHRHDHHLTRPHQRTWDHHDGHHRRHQPQDRPTGRVNMPGS